ncbi:papilin-like isoform X2 [Styela clava]
MIRLAAFATWMLLLVIEGSALSILTIENHDFDEHPPDDGWGEWSEWHSCSRSCGGGVTYMERKCLRNRLRGGNDVECDGPRRMYTSCSIQDCPVNSEDFRTLQCSQHNNQTHTGKKYQWVPYLGESAPNPCELYCQPKTGNFFLKLADKVLDGTPCRPNRFDVCVDGTCESVGCDMLLGSDLRLDVCGECGGDGTSCYLVKRFVSAKLPTGYVPLIFIPPGATNIRVHEKKGTRNFLAVRDSGKRYVLNGHWQVNGSTVIHVGGSNLVYTRKNDRKRAPEIIEMTGPTAEMLYIDVLVQEKNRGIEYEFYLPKGMNDPNHGEHDWITGQWQGCSRECGKGLQKRRVVCKNRNNGEKVLNYHCDAQQRPQSTRECEVISCKTRWDVGEWTPCSKSCGGGLKIRPVSCIVTKDVKTGSSVVPDSRCWEMKPPTQLNCGTDPCQKWFIGDWSACTKSCGAGVERRQVKCSGTLCNITAAPLRERPCNLRPCGGIDWITTEWSECVGVCGNAVQTREVSCAAEDRTLYPIRLCDASKRPSAIQDCGSKSHCPDEPTWIVEEWSECSATCGRGQQTRRVVCGLYEIANYRILSDSVCLDDRNSPKPPTSQECLLGNCTHSWYTGPWGPCSVTCQNGVRTRLVLCIRHVEDFENGTCDTNFKPHNSEICNINTCDENEYIDLPVIPPMNDCHKSTYGCCPDGITLASGPFQASCHLPSCRESEFGCCPDGVTKAEGSDMEGCKTANASLNENTTQQILNSSEPSVTPYLNYNSEMCLQNVDQGPCENWSIYWFFDVKTGQCDRFWFGGCHGNENRFETFEICAKICRKYLNQFNEVQVSTTQQPPTTTAETSVSSQQNNSISSNNANVSQFEPPQPQENEQFPPPSCFLRKSAGPCESRHHRWYFDARTGSCIKFWYGGCGGNDNNFATEQNCIDTCGNRPLHMFDRGLGEENTPPVPAYIKFGHREVYAQVGKMARLACMAKGTPKPTVVWQKEGIPVLPEKERIEILGDYSLILSNITPEEAGTYECVARNGYGPDQALAVKLFVRNRLLIRETPSDTDILAGEPAALRCRIHDDVFFVTWFKDGQKVQTDEYYNIQPWGDLHILDAEVEDSGVYTCTAYATNAQQSASAVLTVSQKEQTSTTATTTRAPQSTRTFLPLPQSPPSRQCRDYPEYANCNIVVLKRMCHKHNYARYCCASCGNHRSAQLPRPGRRRVFAGARVQ